MAKPIIKIPEAVHYVRTGLTPLRLQRIGVITVMWNSVEVDVKRLAWTMGGLDAATGQIVTTDFLNVSLILMARNLLLRSSYHERTKREGVLVLDIFDQMRSRRNGLIHGVPVYDNHGQLSGKLARFSAKKATGSISITEITADDAYLDDIIHNLVMCGEFISDCQRKMENEVQYRSDAGLRRRYSFDSFVFEYRAPEIEEGLLKSYLAKLRPQPPKPDKQNKKPRAKP